MSAALRILPLIAITAMTAQAQTGRITGRVVDSASAQPIPGVSITIVGTQIGATSGPAGEYTISASPGTHQVRALRIGYGVQTREVLLSANQTVTVNFEMPVRALQLTEIVSIGYGTQSLRNVTGSVSAVTTEALERAPVSTLDQVLQGTAPGVHVTTSSGEPGGALSVRIRGTSSITGNAEPLYVIDGFPIENDIEGSSVGNGGRTKTTPPNPLVSLNPSDVESISILKDASATAIYGARGANGVVIITTKQGRGKPQFTLDTYTGLQSVSRRYDLLGAADYMDYANAYGQNSSARYTPFPDSVKSRVLASGIDTDWQDEVFRTAGVKNVQVGIRGATTTSLPTRYALSGGLFDQQGIVIGSGMRRLSSRVNLNQTIGTRLELNGQVTASHARSKSTPTSGQQNANSGAVSAALQYVPILPVLRADGTYSYINTDLNAFNTLLDAPQTPNPVSLAREVMDSLSDTRVLGNFYGQLDLTRGFRFKSSFGADYASRGRYTYYPRTTIRGAQANGEAIRASATTSSWLNENTLTFDRTYGDHEISLLGGYSRQRSDVDGENMSNTNFVSDITGYFDIGSGTQIGGPSVSSRRNIQTLESWLSRVNYALMDRYLLTLTYRADGSSRFAAGRKWGAFPSIALGWRASAEPWFSSRFGYVDELKVRASHGVVGNPSIRPYQSLARLNDQGYSFGGVPYAGYYTTAVGNPDLTWESTKQTDIGLDLGLWDRVIITADYYTKETTDLLLQINLPTETGFQSALANRGTLENRGVELGIDVNIVKAAGRGDFGWHGNVNLSRNRNKVLDLGGQSRIFAEFITTDYNLPGQYIEVGKPIGTFFGYKSGGVIRDSVAAAAVKHTNFNGSKFNAGDILILDIGGATDSTTGLPKGDGKIDSRDQTDLGDATPDLTWGFTNTFSWRSLELTGLIQGVQGGKLLNVNRIRTEGSPRVNVASERWFDAWTPTNPDAKFPKVGENPNQVGPNSFSDALLDDATYVRLRSLTLSYAVPRRWIARTSASTARIYLTGTNLFTITDYTGFDPDVNAQSVGTLNRGIDIGAYPTARSFTTGISITF